MTGNHLRSANGSTRFAALCITATVAALLAAAGLAWSNGFFGSQPAEVEVASQVSVSSDRLDFGSVAPHARAMRKLILLNEGEAPIRASLTLLDTERFTIQPESLLLHPGVSAHVTVTLESGALGAIEDEIQVVLEDAGGAPLLVALEAQVEEPKTLPPAGALLESFSADARDRRGGGNLGAFEADRAGNPERSSAARGIDGYIAGAPAVTGTAPGSVTTAQGAAAPGAAVPVQVTQRTTSPDSRGERAAHPDGGGRLPEGSGVQVRPYDPANAAPFRSLGDQSDPEAIGGDASGVNKLPSRLPSEDLPETLPEEPGTEDDLFDDDPEDPFVGPTLTISSMSTVRILGSQATFYPQRLNVAGTDLGGALGLADAMQFPTVPLAFGESMLFTQAGAAAGGTWDAESGQVRIDLPVHAIDADGDAAPLNLRLTTGTAMQLNEAGIAVAMDGTPRIPHSGMLRLVAVEKIPVGYRNGGEEHLAVFEILANLSFGNTPGSSSPANHGLGRIGG